MDSKDQNLDLTRTKRIYFCPFQSIFVCWAEKRINVLRKPLWMAVVACFWISFLKSS